MSWNARYQAFLTKALKWQMLAIINRDMQAALDWVTGAPGSLQSFLHYHTAMVALEQFPSLLLSTVSQPFERGRGAAELSYTAHFYAALAVAHQDPTVVADTCEDYVRALLNVLLASWEWTQNDFYAAGLPLHQSLYGGTKVSLGLQQGSLRELRIGNAEYPETRTLRRNRGFAQAAVMTIECDMTEV